MSGAEKPAVGLSSWCHRSGGAMRSRHRPGVRPSRRHSPWFEDPWLRSHDRVPGVDRQSARTNSSVMAACFVASEDERCNHSVSGVPSALQGGLLPRQDGLSALGSMKHLGQLKVRRRLPPSDSHTRARQGPCPTQNCCGLLRRFVTPIPLGPMKRFCTCTKDSESPRMRKRRTPSSRKTAQSGEVKLSSLKPPSRGRL